MKNIEIKTLVLGVVQTNCYIISNPATREAIVVDPGAQSNKIIDHLKTNDLECKAILLTHGHFDHIMAADDIKKTYQVPIYANESEMNLLEDPNLNASISFMGQSFSLKADHYVKDGDTLTIAGFLIKVISTPGHTIGGTCYFIPMGETEGKDGEDGILISGDTLFFEEIGRTDLPTGDYSQLISSIKNKLMLLSDDVIVYPGHEQPTTIGHERVNNPYLTMNTDDLF